MSGDPDDEALRWEGDDDPTLAPGWKRVGRPVDVPAEARDAGAGTHADTGAGTRADAGTTDAAASGPVDTGEPAAGAVDADEPVEAEAETEADAATQPGSAELVLLGVFGGVYLLYTIGWILTATGFGALGGDDPVASFMFSVGLWLAAMFLAGVALAVRSTSQTFEHVRLSAPAAAPSAGRALEGAANPPGTFGASAHRRPGDWSARDEGGSL